MKIWSSLTGVMIICLVQGGCSTFGSQPNNLDIGLKFYDNGDFPRAIEALRRYADDNPHDEIAFYNLGLAYQANDQLPQAIAAYERALVVAPRDGRAMVDLALALESSGQAGRAEELFKRACEVEDTRAFPLYSLAGFYQRTGKHDLAGPLHVKALEREPRDLYTNYYYANHLMFNNDPERALIHYRLALEAKPDDLPSFYKTGQVALQLKQWSLAASVYEQALLLAPTNIDARIGCASALIETGEFKRATIHLWAARDFDPDNKAISPLLKRAYEGLLAAE